MSRRFSRMRDGDCLLPAMRRGHSNAAFLFVDLYRFKPINDTYGHAMRDFNPIPVRGRTAPAITERIQPKPEVTSSHSARCCPD